ncbi:thiaminase II [Effusibacillus lacus]|uniref:Aminopyrimidine aminohydrolase n=1 Tax=Effusibacillus lacus TaxID=1348429 RepID=A0A292YMK6_9BACL|nr:thiaminase II [Effusibacillus lacus]TCS71624.1 thiaminase /4-amino-5-aminomethyl-2-methylpyrimidine deaminase [Effusibacillus lacus]GAX90129.1 thiaminase II [Effusibacillus lacus]
MTVATETGTFSGYLREKADAIWQASFQHPFVTGVADGTLPLDRFKFYVMQDAFYLSRFAQVQALGAAKAPDLYTSGRMAFHAQTTYNAELALHEGFAADLGITDEDKAQFQPAPTAYAYTTHMLSVAYTGTLGEIIAAILPCYWLYLEIGERFKGAKPAEPIYQKWIDAYGGDWFAELVREQIARLDSLAAYATEEERRKMEQHFLISSQYEYSFWEMAYRKETWPV